MGRFPQQLSGRSEIEPQPKVELSARVRFGVPGAHPSKMGAVQVRGLGLKMRGVAGLANQDAG